MYWKYCSTSSAHSSTDLRCRQNKTVQCFVLGSVQSTRQQDANTIKSPPRSCWSREGMPLVAFIKSSFLSNIPRSKGARKVFAKETNERGERKKGREEGRNQRTEDRREASNDENVRAKVRMNEAMRRTNKTLQLNSTLRYSKTTETSTT